jgi:hypothetical protein
MLKILSGVIEEKYSMLCQKLSTSTSPGEMRVIDALWWYYISKIFEFFDTVLMVLRKKNNQISFLHVFHHASIVNSSKFSPFNQYRSRISIKFLFFLINIAFH